MFISRHSFLHSLTYLQLLGLARLSIVFLLFFALQTIASAADWRTKLHQYQVDQATKATRLATKQTAAIAKKQAEYYKLIEFASQMTDKRSLQYITNFNLETYANRHLWQQWQKVYAKSYPLIKYIPYPSDAAERSGASPIRIIAEMRVTDNYTNLDKELSYFRANGYNTILATWQGKTPYKLYSQIQHVKAQGWNVWLAYSGPEKLESPVLINTTTYAQALKLLASTCSGFITGWRRTSLHLWHEQSKWLDFTLNQVRQGNPNIYIFGEIYYGYDGRDDNHHKFSYNIPTNASGAIVVNLGNANHNQESIFKTLANPKTQRSDSGASLPLFSLVVGEHPYYLSRNRNLKTKEQNRSICHQVEQRITRAGFAGSITLAGDGSDGNYQPQITDDVSQSDWHVTTKNKGK
ncbi:MAG: hypothetical protein L3J71_03455 [Victivallaceae bacterium]|nr:hypothetical protein [Victivallaceae bacterium]